MFFFSNSAAKVRHFYNIEEFFKVILSAIFLDICCIFINMTIFMWKRVLYEKYFVPLQKYL